MFVAPVALLVTVKHIERETTLNYLQLHMFVALVALLVTVKHIERGTTLNYLISI